MLFTFIRETITIKYNLNNVYFNYYQINFTYFKILNEKNIIFFQFVIFQYLILLLNFKTNYINTFYGFFKIYMISLVFPL